MVCLNPADTELRKASSRSDNSYRYDVQKLLNPNDKDRIEATRATLNVHARQSQRWAVIRHCHGQPNLGRLLLLSIPPPSGGRGRVKNGSTPMPDRQSPAEPCSETKRSSVRARQRDQALLSLCNIEVG